MEKLPYIKILLLLNLLILTVSCQSINSVEQVTIVEHKPLKYQRLYLRKDYPNYLTNRAGNSIQKHDLRDPDVRFALNSFIFACKIGSVRFRICRDFPGFCRKTLECIKYKRSFFKKECIEYKKIKYSIIDDFQKLVMLRTTCMSVLVYPNFDKSINKQ